MHTIWFFDLDGTVIDSSHRQGETLDEWRAMNTPENIRDDVPLVLAETMRVAIRAGLNVNILTSRVMGAHDLRWLVVQDMLPTNTPILSRRRDDNRAAGSYKLATLLDYSQRNKIKWQELIQRAVIFDDDEDVQHTLRAQGFTVIDPEPFNRIYKEGEYTNG